MLFVLTDYKPNYYLRKQLPFSISWQLAKRNHHANEWIVYLQREVRESQFDTHKEKNGNFSVQRILIIWESLLMCASLVRSVEQKQRANHTRCCFLFKRISLCVSHRCLVLQKSSGQSAGAAKWIASLAGWSSDRRHKCVMDILSWMTALRFQVEPVSISNLWNHSPTSNRGEEEASCRAAMLMGNQIKTPDFC